MTDLSGAYITWTGHLRLFGGVQADMLECVNCPIVEDVLTSTAYSMANWALRHSGTYVGADPAGRLLVE